MDRQSQSSSVQSEVFVLKQEIHKYSVSGYKDYEEFLDNMDKSKNLFIFYTGSESPNSGYTWCPTSTEAAQILEKYLAEHQDVVFLTVYVGSQEEWEDKTNPFRQDEELKLKVIPTLLKYRTFKRLEGNYCMKPEILDLLFEEECEGT